MLTTDFARFRFSGVNSNLIWGLFLASSRWTKSLSLVNRDVVEKKQLPDFQIPVSLGKDSLTLLMTVLIDLQRNYLAINAITRNARISFPRAGQVTRNGSNWMVVRLRSGYQTSPEPSRAKLPSVSNLTSFDPTDPFSVFNLRR